MSSSSSPHRRHRRHRRRPGPLTVVGLLVLLVGVGALGWVGYQTWGTNLVSQHAFTTEKDVLRAHWQQATPRPSPGRASTPTTGASRSTKASPGSSHEPGRGPEPERAPEPGQAIALLRIPRFGSGFEVPVLEGTDLSTLSRGVGHYRKTAMPGQVGNFALAGHRITHGQPFAKLLDLDRGDEVVVETQTSVYTYVIDEPPRSLTVKASGSWVLDPVPGQPTARPSQALITLTTCQDLFHSPDRSIGFGHLASTTNKS